MYSKQPKMLRSLLVSLVVLCSLCVALTRSQPLGSGDSSDEAIADLVEATQPDQDSLPPDTFRKLAQALYQRGDKAENRLQRKFFYNDNVTCNDGSVAGFYIRRNYQSKRWIIFLEGRTKRRNNNCRVLRMETEFENLQHKSHTR